MSNVNPWQMTQATFTMALKELVPQTYGDFSDDSVDWSPTWPALGLDWYPVFDQTASNRASAYRVELNKKIIMHFWNREIGQETPSLFKLAMARKMNEIMALYNQLYLSEFSRLDISPLQTENMLRSINGSNTTNRNTSTDTNTNNNSNNTSSSRTVSSTTPQMMLSGDGDYADNGVDVNGTSTSTATGSSTSTGTDAETGSNSTTDNDTGFSGIPSGALVNAWRSAMLNIDALVIADLESLFMRIWDNGDSYSPHGFDFGGLVY